MLQVWKRIIRNYFTFNKRERRGLYVLLLLLTGLTITHAVIRLSPPPAEPISEEDKALLKELTAAVRPVSKQATAQETVASPIEPVEVQWIAFDPNQAGMSTLQDLGLDSSIAQRLVNYRSKGGRFHDVDDVMHIYGMDSGWVKQAIPYMTFPSRQNKRWLDSPKHATGDTTTTKPKRVIRIVELNTADSLDLIQIPGVGGYYAGEIIEMRERMGGIWSHEQLLDIYNMRDQTFESLLEYTTVDTTLAERININTCDLKRLGKHPYLTWKQARVIINYRDQHGAFAATRDIMKTEVIPDSVFQLVEPYITVK